MPCCESRQCLPVGGFTLITYSQGGRAAGGCWPGAWVRGSSGYKQLRGLRMPRDGGVGAGLTGSD